MEPDELNVKNEVLSVHWSELSVQDRCNRLLNTLSQRKKGLCIPCSMCDHMKPSDRRTAHEVHFLSHHTIESDTKEEVFGYAGIPNLPTYDNAWQLSRNKIARRNKSLQQTVLTPPSEDGPDCVASSSNSNIETNRHQSETSDTSSSQRMHNHIASSISSTSMDITSHSASLSSTNVSDGTVVKISSVDGSRSDDSTPPNASTSQRDTSNSLDANLSMDSRHSTSLPEPLNFTSTLHSKSSIIMPNPIYHGINSSHTSNSLNESDRQLNSVVPSSASSSLLFNTCSVIKGPHILPRNGPVEGTSSFTCASSSSFTPTTSRFSHPSTTIDPVEVKIESVSSEETESTSILTETLVSSDHVAPPVKRKRGRPRKYFPEMSSSNGSSTDGTVIRRKRGRPRKNPPDLLNRKSGKSKKSKVALNYNNTSDQQQQQQQQQQVIVRGKGRPRKDATVLNIPTNSSITIQKYTINSQSNNNPTLDDPCIDTHYMSEKARELFLKQCQVSFHSERTKKQQRIEERRRLTQLLRIEKKFQSQSASELDSDPKSATEEDDDDESDNDLSSSDEDDTPAENESASSISLNQLNDLDTTTESTSSLNLVPTTLPGIFFTNPNISIEVLPASRKNPTRNVRRHS